MKRQATILIMMLPLLISAQLYAQKIPITSASSESISWYKKGWLLENKLELDSAEAAYNQALSFDSNFALAHLRLAMLRDNYTNRRANLKSAMKYYGHISQGERLWISARNDFYGAGNEGNEEYSLFKKLVELYPNDEKANYFFGFVNVHHGTHDPNTAIKYYSKAIELNPTYIIPYNELAYAYASVRDFVNAKRIAQKLIYLLPESVNPLDTYAEILMQNGEYEKSIVAYDNVLQKNSTYPWAIMGIAANLNFLNRHKEARAILSKLDVSILSDYEYRHKWKSMVVSFLDEGNIDGAIATLNRQKEVSLSGENAREPAFHVYYSHLRTVNFYLEDNHAAKALEAYEKWNEYVQRNSKKESSKKRVRNLRAYYMAYKSYIDNDLKLALTQLQQYDKLSDTQLDASRTLKAKIFIKQKQFDEAVILLLDGDLSNHVNQYWLAMAYNGLSNAHETEKWKHKIVNANERNKINLALVRQKAINIKVQH